MSLQVAEYSVSWFCCRHFQDISSNRNTHNKIAAKNEQWNSNNNNNSTTTPLYNYCFHLFFFVFSLSMHSMHNIFKCEQRIGWLNVIVIWRDTARHSLLTWVVPLFHLYDIYLYVRQYLLGCSFLFTIFKHTFWKLTEELNNNYFLNLLNGVVFFSRFTPKTPPIRFVELFQIGSDYCGILFLFH